MPIPKKGDIVRWTTGAIWEIIETPQRNSNPALWPSISWEARAVLQNKDYRAAGTVDKIVFCGETVEEAGWEYVESPFQQFVRETLDKAESQ